MTRERAVVALWLTIAAVAAWAAMPGSARAEVDPAVLQAEAERVAVVARASQCTVAVFAATGQGGGSGVLISPDGYALSNFHVTREAGEAMKCGLADGQLYDAVIVGIDPTGDVALIKLLGREDFPYAEMADSDKVQAGDWCFAIGNPFLLATDFQPTVSYGVVSGVHRYQYPAGTLLEYADCIQADAAINPGNSGGPLFNSQGQLIGINGRGSFEKRGRVNVGVGYAISINQIKHFLGHLKSGRIVDHATLGATLRSDEEKGVIVEDILEDSDAYRRGLRYGDEILRFAGRDIHTANAFKNALGIFPKGWRVPLTYRRKGEQFDILVRLSGVHRDAELAMLVNGPAHQPQPNPRQRPRGGPEQPQPKPGEMPQLPMFRPKPQMPEIAKKNFVSKPGYVNYHFNQLNQDRIWNAFNSRGSFSSLTGNWTIEGEIATGGDFQLILEPNAAQISLPGGEQKLELDESLHDDLNPPGSGGLLVALSEWRRLLTGGPANFGQVYYLGTMPWGNGPWSPSENLLDVLVGIHAGVECRFMFDPSDGQMVGMEMWSDEHDDPCEIYFADYRAVDGHLLPHRLEVRYRDSIYQVFQTKQYKFE